MAPNKPIWNDPAWTPLSGDMMATGGSMSVNLDSGASERFYRILLVN